MKKIIVVILVISLIVGCKIRNPICREVPFVYKIDDKPTINSYCSHYTEYCTDKSWWTGNCIDQELECDETTIQCSIKIKNYENQKGTFGLSAYFETENGIITKPIIWKDIYPNEEETFIWTYVKTPYESSITCHIVTESIPKKAEC